MLRRELGIYEDALQWIEEDTNEEHIRVLANRALNGVLNERMTEHRPFEGDPGDEQPNV